MRIEKVSMVFLTIDEWVSKGFNSRVLCTFSLFRKGPERVKFSYSSKCVINTSKISFKIRIILFERKNRCVVGFFYILF